MDNGKEYEERDKFDILDLPEYDYLYKPEGSSFSGDFSFSIANEPKFSPPSASVNTSYFLNEKYASSRPAAKMPSVKEKSLEYFSANMSQTHSHIEDPSFIQFPQRRETREYQYPPYAPGNRNEQAVFVNANQYQYIKRRKERRDYLDSLEKRTNAAYQHESRHKHAMKRPRAPSGRFLTKEEAFLEGSKNS